MDVDEQKPIKPHDWFEWHGMTCCRSCGWIKNATSDTRSCKGPVKVALRATQA